MVGLLEEDEAPLHLSEAFLDRIPFDLILRESLLLVYLLFQYLLVERYVRLLLHFIVKS